MAAMLRELGKGCAVVLIEAGLGAAGFPPAFLIASGVALLLIFHFWPKIWHFRSEYPVPFVLLAGLFGFVLFASIAWFWPQSKIQKPSPLVQGPTRHEPTAAELAEEIAKRIPAPTRTGRQLSEWQRVMLTSELAHYPGTKILILVSRGEETLAYANDFKEVFLTANWKPEGPKIAPPELGVMDVRIGADNAATPRPVVLSLLAALKIARVKSAQRYILDEHIGRDSMVLWVGSQSPEGWSPEALAPIGVPKEYWTRPDGPPEPGDVSRPGIAPSSEQIDKQARLQLRNQLGELIQRGRVMQANMVKIGQGQIPNPRSLVASLVRDSMAWHLSVVRIAEDNFGHAEAMKVSIPPVVVSYPKGLSGLQSFKDGQPGGYDLSQMWTNVVGDLAALERFLVERPEL